jgi:sugar lactone lactonase YvrE
MTAVVSIATDHVDLLGESPCWRPADQCLYWVDAFAPAIRRLDPSTGEVRSFAMPADIGSFVFAADGSVVAGLRTGFSRLRLGQEGARFIANPLPGDPRLMLNDGKCDRRGRYWCASVHSDFVGRQAALYRLDPDLSIRQVDDGFIIGNGIAFSPDDRRMYLADSRDETVWVYDLDIDTGTVSNRRVFFSTAEIEGRVDGATCDSDGNYWCALVHGAAVACISPAGRLIERIAVPVRHPTMVAFGGPDLDRLYVTSATALLEPDERADWPAAGKLLRIDGLGVRGIVEPVFGRSFEPAGGKDDE